MIRLKCSCQITQEGTFEVSDQCKECLECNTISKLHPFGVGRFKG